MSSAPKDGSFSIRDCNMPGVRSTAGIASRRLRLARAGRVIVPCSFSKELEHRAHTLRPRAGRDVSAQAADHASSLSLSHTVRLVGITRSEVSHAGYPCGVEEAAVPEFWQCACEQQICSRPKADWQLSAGVLQGGSLGSCHRRPRTAGHLLSCLARRTLHKDNTRDYSTPRRLHAGFSWCCSSSHALVGVDRTTMHLCSSRE